MRALPAKNLRDGEKPEDDSEEDTVKARPVVVMTPAVRGAAVTGGAPAGQPPRIQIMDASGTSVHVSQGGRPVIGATCPATTHYQTGCGSVWTNRQGFKKYPVVVRWPTPDFVGMLLSHSCSESGISYALLLPRLPTCPADVERHRDWELQQTILAVLRRSSSQQS